MGDVLTLYRDGLMTFSDEAFFSDGRLDVERIEDLAGTEGLYTVLEGRLQRSGLTKEQQANIMVVAGIMHEFHQDDTRSDGDGRYEGHLLRTTLNLLDFVEDDVMARAMLLHDVVEDHAREIVASWGNFAPTIVAGMSELQLQQEALYLMGKNERIGPEVAGLVAQVTNKPFDPNRFPHKNKQYAHQVAALPEKDERAQIIKIVDQIDNALRIHRIRNNPKLAAKLDGKYELTFPTFIGILKDNLQVISTETRLWLLEKFIEGYEACQARNKQRRRVLWIAKGTLGKALTFAKNIVE